MEKVFFDQAGVTVTNTRFLVRGQTYVMRNITSVKIVKYSPNRGNPAGLLFIGIFIACYAYASSAYIAGFFAILIVGFAIYWFFIQRPNFGLVIATSGGEVRALIHSDRSFVHGVVAAFNQSIMSHV